MKIRKSLGRLFHRLKARAFLSAISVAIGVTSVVVIGYIGDMGALAVNKELDNLGMDGLTITANAGANPGYSLKEADLEALAKNQSVQTAEPLLIKDSYIIAHSKKTNATLFGLKENPEVLKLDLLYGRKLKFYDIKANANVCMIDEELARKIYSRANIIGKQLTVFLNNREEQLKVIGIVKSGSGILENIAGSVVPSFIYIPYTTFQRISGNDSIERIAVKLKDGENIGKVSDDLVRNLELNSGFKGIYNAQNLSGQRESLQRLLTTVTTVLSAIGGISLIVAGLGIMTAMLVSVKERTREIGIKKSIGAKNYKILSEFIAEAFLISIIGCACGMFIGISAAYAGAKIFSREFIFSYKRYILCMLISVLIGCSFGAYPAYKAARLKPVDALRRE